LHSTKNDEKKKNNNNNQKKQNKNKSKQKDSFTVAMGVDYNAFIAKPSYMFFSTFFFSTLHKYTTGLVLLQGSTLPTLSLGCRLMRPLLFGFALTAFNSEKSQVF